MKIYKVVYSIANQPGKKVTLVQAANEYDAKYVLCRQFGAVSQFDANISIWEVTEA